MQRNLYFENYINNLQKNVFVYAYDNNFNIVDFISFYMKSGIRKEMDKPYTYWHNQCAIRIFGEMIYQRRFDVVNNQKINKDAVEWLGFFYSKWHFITGESSRSIIKFLPPKKGLEKYFVLHQLDEVEAIEMCKRHYNLSRNNHRKNEYKNCGVVFNENENPLYYSFLAKRILYKLSKDQIFKQLRYIGNFKQYDFIDNDNSLAIKGNLVYEASNVKDVFKNSDDESKSFKIKATKSIYFSYVINENNLFEELKQLKASYPPNKRNYDYLYFYSNGKLFEINSSNELYVYSIPLSKREISGIHNEMVSLKITNKRNDDYKML